MSTPEAVVRAPWQPTLFNRMRDVVSARPLVTALGVYIALRAFSLIVLAVWVSSRHTDLVTVLGRRYDAHHYVAIAVDGYSTMNLAFFPLFPSLIRAALVLPWSAAVAAITIAWVASLAAAAGIFKVGSHVAGRRAGLMLVALWAVLPHGLVESMAYTEGLFTAFAAWSLYSVLHDRWIAAGLLCCLAGLTRPTAVALIAALGVAALVAVFQRRRWIALAAPAIGSIGWLGYLAWVAHRVGRIDGWFWVQRTYWHSRFDGGRYNLREVQQILEGHRNFLMLYVVTAVVLCAVLLLVLSISSRQPLVLVLYSASVLALTLASNTGFNKARLLVPAFALLLPPALALAKARTHDAVAVVATGALASAWFGGYLALIWHWSP